jgi:predicted ATPase
MKLIELELSNFKVFGESTRIPIRPITLIFGPNSSGKSSVIQSLLLMKQTIMAEGLDGSSLVFRGSSTDLGNYSELVHDHDHTKLISIGVTLEFSDEVSALQAFSEETGLEAKSAEITLKTNFVAGRNSREGLVYFRTGERNGI